MTAEEAYTYLRKTLDDTAFFDGKDYCYDEEMEMAVSALQKQIPQEPLLDMDTDDYGYVCPDCGRWVNMDMDFCPKCGQALKWEGDD